MAAVVLSAGRWE